MKIAEILEIEKSNTENILLFKEGICWRIYERSVWRFIRNIKECNVFRKYVKSIKQDIVYIAFTEIVLSKILKTLETKYAISNTFHNNEIYMEIRGVTETDGFEEWRSKIEIKPDLNKGKELQNQIDELKKQIYRIERINLVKHFEKLETTLSERFKAINTIGQALTNIIQKQNNLSQSLETIQLIINKNQMGALINDKNLEETNSKQIADQILNINNADLIES